MKNRDIDYLYISARLKCLEKDMMSLEKLNRIILAKNNVEAVKLLVESGWEEFSPIDLPTLEVEIDAHRQQAFELLYTYLPQKSIVDVFRLKYDYHNIKAIIKADIMGVDASPLLSSAGTISAGEMMAILREKTYHNLEPIMASATVNAQDVLVRTTDPQIFDLILDRALCEHMLAFAEKSESSFLKDYVKLFIDLANLRVVIRAGRVGKGFDYLRKAIAPGGTVSPTILCLEATPDFVTGAFSTPYLLEAAQVAAKVLSEKGGLAPLDMVCDNTLINYIKKARYLPFGESCVIAYVAAIEAEIVAVRTVIAGRLASLTPEQINERLRLSYV